MFNTKKKEIMRQLVNFDPRFRKDNKSVYFSTRLDALALIHMDLDDDIQYYQTYGDQLSYKDRSSLSSLLRPTNYESYGFMDIGDDLRSWYPIFILLGFESSPNKSYPKQFMFGCIKIKVSRCTNGFGGFVFKLQGNTTRTVIDLIIQSLMDLKQWIDSNDLQYHAIQLNPDFVR